MLKQFRCPHGGFLMLSHSKQDTCRRRTKYTCHFLRFLYHNSLFITSSNVMGCAPLWRQGFLLCGLLKPFNSMRRALPSCRLPFIAARRETEGEHSLLYHGHLVAPGPTTLKHLLIYPTQRAHEPRRKIGRRCDAARTTTIAHAGGGGVQGMPDSFDSFITN